MFRLSASNAKVSRFFSSKSVILPFRTVSSTAEVTKRVTIPEQSIDMYFNSLVQKASNKKNTVPLGNLKILLLKCEVPEHKQYALDAIDIFQTRPMDFSEEICSHFIEIFLKKLNDPVTAAKIVCKKEHRLGAWMTKKSTETLLQALSVAGEVHLMIDVVEMLDFKAVLHEPVASAETLLKAASAKGDSALYEAALNTCGKIVSEVDLISLRHAHPGPAPSEDKANVAGPPSAA